MTATSLQESLARTWPVSRLDVIRYAGASLDHNDIHLDDDAARRAGYDGVIAHGMLTLGRVLAHVADVVGPDALSSCRSRFAAPVGTGSALTARVTAESPSEVSLSVADDAGAEVLAVDLVLGGPAPAEAVVGDVVADRVLVVERGPATRFAETVDARGAHWFDGSAATEAGLPGIPVVPTFAFALPGWGWFPDLQPEPGERPDAVRDCRAWTGTDGAVVHAGQDFAYHRGLRVGDVVRATSHVVRRFSKSGRTGTLHFTVVAQRLVDRTGEPVLTSTMTLLVRQAA